MEKITLVHGNLSGNSLARTYLAAKLLSPHFDVIIKGIMLDGHIWKPLKQSDIKIEPFQIVKNKSMYRNIMLFGRKLISDNNILYACGVLATSFGVCLLSNILKKRTTFLDIDDWKTAGYRGLSNMDFAIKLLQTNFKFNGAMMKFALEALIPLSEFRTTPSPMLAEKYNGYFLASGCDPSLFNPDRYDSNKVKSELGIPLSKRIIMFGGTARPHKGIEELIKACLKIGRNDFLLILLGVDLYSDYWKKLTRYGFDGLLGLPFIPMQQLPKYLSIADIVVLPQKLRGSAVGQVPVKLFDAMAMGKPIIISDASDFRYILGDNGVYIDPGNIGSIADAIEKMIYDEKKCEEIGIRLRNLYEKKYSLEVLSTKLYRHIKTHNLS